mmetsp:Transcript_1232/g.3859  ORF Transcript_1232/g.3859 Transcript_1232/m.3859 type:complete len:206 (-) Transcript_1232:877-1494(-)
MLTPQRSSRVGSSTYERKAWRYCEAVASSITRRSQDILTVMLVATRGSESIESATTRFTPPPIAMMQACGGLITAENSEIPNMPRLETVKVPPWYSSGISLPSWARPARSLTAEEMSLSPRRSTPVTIGVISPVGVATATETSMESLKRFADCAASKLALASGTSRNASATARMTRSFTETLTSHSSFKYFLKRSRASSSLSIAT